MNPLVIFPLAAADDWLKFVVPLVFLIIYAINHILAASKPKPPVRTTKPPRRLPPVERAPRAPQPVQSEPAGQQAQLNAEIEQFLKRADARRGDAARRQPQQPPKQIKPPLKPPKPQQQEARREARSRRNLSDEVAQSVEKHLGDRGFEKRAEHLADDITRADQQMEDHLQKAFNRKVGTLGDEAPAQSTPVTDTPTEAVADAPSAAAQIATLLANPQSVKQAVVLAEIFARPEQRW